MLPNTVKCSSFILTDLCISAADRSMVQRNIIPSSLLRNAAEDPSDPNSPKIILYGQFSFLR